ncbi:MAG TPA: hypothetical protein VFA39_20005 [Steroidobacteraceae bacterium]|nr:hypothetical protein [Steroidobacteraceae bacterium]
MLYRLNTDPTLAMIAATAILICGAVALLGLALWIRSRDPRRQRH